jgi:hypothetical protein
MPQLSEDANTILRRMQALGANPGDYVLMDVFAALLDDNEQRVASALDELISLRLVVSTSGKDALAMTRAGARYRTNM